MHAEGGIVTARLIVHQGDAGCFGVELTGDVPYAEYVQMRSSDLRGTPEDIVARTVQEFAWTLRRLQRVAAHGYRPIARIAKIDGCKVHLQDPRSCANIDMGDSFSVTETEEGLGVRIGDLGPAMTVDRVNGIIELPARPDCIVPCITATDWLWYRGMPTGERRFP